MRTDLLSCELMLTVVLDLCLITYVIVDCIWFRRVRASWKGTAIIRDRRLDFPPRGEDA
jgi:hypothetical protein